MSTFRTMPLDPNFGRVLEMGRNLSESALALGLSSTKAVRVKILGMNVPQGWAAQASRDAIVSFSQPPTSQYDTELWVNPINKRIFKSLPSERQWKLVLTYTDLYADVWVTAPTASAPGDSVGQPIQDIPTLLALDTTNMADKTMYYVEDERAIYAIDTQSSDPVTATVLKPNVGPGRWFLITSTAGAIGNIDGGIY